jgi:ribonuclease HI
MGGLVAGSRRRRLKIFFDGGCRPNPGRIEVAVVARGVATFFDDLGCGTSSDAEWFALRMALQVAHGLGEPFFDLIGDSAGVITQASGASRGRSQSALDHLAKYEEIAAAGRPRRIVWTPRNHNLAGIALVGGRSSRGGVLPMCLPKG